MDLDSLNDPHNSHCDINNPLNNNSSKSDIEIANLNESTLTKVQKQNQTENLKIVDNNDAETSKQQVSSKKVIETSIVLNTPKKNEHNIDPHNSQSHLNSLFNNDKNVHGIEVTKLNESTSTIIQEQKKTVNLEIVNNNDVEISKQQVPLKKAIGTSIVLNTPKKNEYNVDPHNSQSDLNSLLNNDKNVHGIEVTKLNESTSAIIQEQKKTVNLEIVDNNDVEISKQQVSLKKAIGTSIVLNTPKKNEYNVDPHNSQSDLNSLLNIDKNVHGIEVTKLNESTSTIVQEQKKTVNFKIVDNNDLKISKQVPLKKVIGTTIIINTSKKNEYHNIDPHISQSDLNSLLNIDKNVHGIEVTKLNETTSTIVQEQKKTVNLKIVDNNDVKISKQAPLKKVIGTTIIINAPKKNEHNIDPHNSQSDLNSLLNIDKNVHGIEVTKLNESTSTIVQEQKKTINLEIVDNNDVEISKQQVSLKKVIGTSIVINAPKKNEHNIDPRNSQSDLNSLLNIDKNVHGIEVTKLNESISTIVQEQKKTVNLKIVDNNDVKISKQVPLKKVIGTTIVINTPKKNEHNIDPHNSQSDINSLLNNDKNVHGIEVTKLNESTSPMVQEQKKTVNFKILDNNDLKISKQVPLNIITAAYVINATKTNENKIYLKPNNLPLNLEKIAVPKSVISNMKIIPSFISSQIKKSPTISIIPATTLIQPKSTINTNLQPKLNQTEVLNNKCISTLKPGFKIISSNDSKSKMLILPKGVNYILKTIKKEDVKNPALPSVSPTSTILKPVNSIIPISVAEKFNTIEKREIKYKNSKFVFGMKEFQNRRLQVLPSEENICARKDSNLFNSTIDFQHIYKRSSKLFVKSQKRSLKPHTDSPNPKLIKIANISESKHVEQEKELSFKTSSMNKITNSTDFTIRSEEKKLIPHTITSKDVIDNHPKVVIENYKTKLNTNVEKALCPTSGFIQISRPESLVKTYGRPLTVTKYGNFSSNELNTVRLVPLNSLNQSETKLNTNIPGNGKHLFIKILKNNGSVSNATISKVSTDKIMKVIPSKIYAPNNSQIIIAPKENQKKIPLVKPIKFLLPKEIKQEKHNPDYGDKLILIRCEYEYCQKLVKELELIDKLYCSVDCKKLDIKLKLATKRHVIEEPQEELPKKSAIDRKLLLAKLKSRINKRKQCLPSMVKENEAEHVDLGLVEKPHKETLKIPPPIPIPIPLTVKRTFQKSQNKKNPSHPNGRSIVIQNGKLDNATLQQVISSYLQHTDYIPAPKKLFDNPFPYDSNPFKVGQRLEGIDPEHEALFCVMSVVEVLGYRIKLHFDGYSNIYDFWVNANCPDLFYPRWCNENFRILQPPKNYKLPFNWTDYLRLPGVMPAPKWNFPSTIYLNHNTNHSFRIGAKLEALDKLTRTLPKQLICVATVADILNSRIRIHFDGWTDDFDYWTDITSTNIHPVGWCDKNGRTLCPPSGHDNFKGKKPFSWAQYLKETNSEPVPEDSFVRRPLREFTNSMAIEVVDIANPSLVRIAKVVDVKGDELKILYDGFDTIYAYWIEDDSPNIHPLGWCLSTEHPIELFKVNAILWSCRVPGCNGKGNIQSSKNNHVFAKDCPYEFENWKNKISGLTNTPDRIRPEDIPISVPSCSKSVNIVPQEDKKNEKKKKQKPKLNKTKNYNFNKPKKRIIDNKLKKNIKRVPNGRTKTVYSRAVEAMNELEIMKNVNDYTSYGYGSLNPSRLNVWNRHNALEGIPIFNTSDARKWTVQEVATFVEKIVTNNYTDNNSSYKFKISNIFINQEIDGDGFLMLTQEDLMDILHIPLCPALKLHNAIIVLRQRTSGFDVANGVL